MMAKSKIQAGVLAFCLLLFCVLAPVLAQSNPNAGEVEDPPIEDETRLFVQGGYFLGYEAANQLYPALIDLRDGSTANTPLLLSLRDYNVADDGTTTTYTFAAYVRGEGRAADYGLYSLSLRTVVPNSEASERGSDSDMGITAITNRYEQCVESAVGPSLTQFGTAVYRYLTRSKESPPTDQPLNGPTSVFRANSTYPDTVEFPLIRANSSPVKILTFRCEVPSAQITSRTVLGFAIAPQGYQGAVYAEANIKLSSSWFSILRVENSLAFRPASSAGGVYAKRIRLESDRQGVIVEFSEEVTGVDSNGSDFQIFNFNLLHMASTVNVVSAVPMNSSRTYRLRFAEPLTSTNNIIGNLNQDQFARRGNLFGLERVGTITGTITTATVGRLGPIYVPEADPFLYPSPDFNCPVPKIISSSFDASMNKLSIDFGQDILHTPRETTGGVMATYVTSPFTRSTALGSVNITSVTSVEPGKFVISLEYRSRAGDIFDPADLAGGEDFTLELEEAAFRCTRNPFIPAEMIQTIVLRAIDNSSQITDNPPQITSLLQVPVATCATSRTVTVSAEDLLSGISRITYTTGSDVSTVCAANNPNIPVNVSISTGTSVSGTVLFSGDSEPQPLCFSVFETGTNGVTTRSITVGAVDATSPTLTAPTVMANSIVSVAVTDISQTCGVASMAFTVRAVSVAPGVMDCSLADFSAASPLTTAEAVVNGSRTYTYSPLAGENGRRICFRATDGSGGVGYSVVSALVSGTVQVPDYRIFNIRVFLGGAF